MSLNIQQCTDSKDSSYEVFHEGLEKLKGGGRGEKEERNKRNIAVIRLGK